MSGWQTVHGLVVIFIIYFDHVMSLDGMEWKTIFVLYWSFLWFTAAITHDALHQCVRMDSFSSLSRVLWRSMLYAHAHSHPYSQFHFNIHFHSPFLYASSSCPLTRITFQHCHTPSHSLERVLSLLGRSPQQQIKGEAKRITRGTPEVN